LDSKSRRGRYGIYKSVTWLGADIEIDVLTVPRIPRYAPLDAQIREEYEAEGTLCFDPDAVGDLATGRPQVEGVVNVAKDFAPKLKWKWRTRLCRRHGEGE
jgi:hypothetical protein